MHSLNHNIAPDDYDINYRTADSAAGHNARLSFCILHAGRDVASIAKVVTRLCIGCDGSGIGMVAADSGDGDDVNS